MPISEQELAKIARLAYLETEPENSSQLSSEITAIMDFVEQLRAVDTSQVTPMFHPFDLHQRLRPDTVTEQACVDKLDAIAPAFADGLYLVPKVIDSGN